MNYNNLIFFTAVFCLGAFQLKAQTGDSKLKNQIISTQIKDVKPIQIESLESLEVKSEQMVNRHRELINAMVKSRIECTSDLFIVINNKVVC